MARQSEHSKHLYLLDDLDDCRKYALQMITSTRRKLNIFARQLNPLIYAQSNLIDALSQVARQNRDCQIRLLIGDYRLLTEHNPTLLALIRRLPSRFSVRTLRADEDTDPLLQHLSLIMADQSGLFLQHHESDFQGFANFAASAELQRFTEPFEHYWNNACVNKNLAQLHL